MLPVVDFTLGVAEQWVELFATLSRRAQLIPAHDLLSPRRQGTSGSASSSVRGTTATSGRYLASAWRPSTSHRRPSPVGSAQPRARSLQVVEEGS